MISFEQILRDFNSRHPEVALAWGDNPDHRGLRMFNRPLPVSISEAEANYLHDFIVRHHLVRGLDLATGVGISALAMGLAMKNGRGGQVLSLDNYAEEALQEQQIGGPPADYLNVRSAATWVAPRLLEYHCVADYVDLMIGTAPGCLRHVCGPFDVVMLDCPKCDHDLAEFLDYLHADLAGRFALFLHDSHTMPRCREIVRKCLGVELVSVLPGQKYPLLLATNIPDAMGKE